MRKKYLLKIYKTRWHLIFTFGIIIIPFIFFLTFSKIFGIPSGKLFSDIFVSFNRLLIAYLIAVFIGWILAALFYRGRGATIALPLFDVLQSFPTFAVLPLAIFWGGVSEKTIIFFLVLAILWPIFFSIISSLKLMKHEWEEAVEIMQLKGWKYIFNFLFPVSIPGLITGSIIGLGEGWEALMATEIIIGTHVGLGSFFQSFSQNFSVTAFGVLGFLIIIFTINKVLWLPLLEKSHKQMED
ncbi:ABC transporter permease subunit [Candidatus Azambacteria bacterium]|nr:ABC transporter permease subunit [Candidatus Azambacteria bacterium]